MQGKMQDIWQPLITIKVGSLFCPGASQIWLEDLETHGLANPSSQENEGKTKRCGKMILAAFSVRPARTYSNGWKPLTRPYSGKRPAGGKGVRRETESEGSPRQTSDLTYRNHI